MLGKKIIAGGTILSTIAIYIESYSWVESILVSLDKYTLNPNDIIISLLLALFVVDYLARNPNKKKPQNTKKKYFILKDSIKNKSNLYKSERQVHTETQ